MDIEINSENLGKLMGQLIEDKYWKALYPIVNDRGMQWQLWKTMDSEAKGRMFLAVIQDLKANGRTKKQVLGLVAQYWGNLPGEPQGRDAGLMGF